MMSRLTLSRPLLRLLAAGLLVAAGASVATAQPTNPVKLMKGVITDSKTGRPVDGGRVFVYLGQKEISQSRINPSTGAFQVILGPSTDYRFVLRSNRFLPTEAKVRTPDGTNYQEVVHNLTMDPIPVGSTIYGGRLFDQGSTELKTNGEFAKALAFMKESQAATLKITVLPDAAAKKAPAKAPAKGKKGKKGAAAPAEEPAPATDAGATLAQSRMQALKAYLQREGISLTRIKWELPTTPAELQAAAGRKENVVITITGIDVEEVEEEDS